MKNKKDNFKNHTLFKALKKWLSEMQENVNEIGQETALAKELLFYIPIGTALIFFYFTNNLSYMYHSFGNYGFEENFLTQIVPLVKAFQHGDLSGARLGIAGPLYPVILAAYNTLFGGDILKGALFINVLSGTAALLLFFFFLKRLAGSPTALISIVLLAVNPLFFEFTYTASSAPLLLFYTLAASLLFLRAFENGKGAVSLALAALFSTLAVLTNISTIILPIFGLALLIRTARYRQAAVFTAALLLFLIPAAIFISAVTPRLFDKIPFIVLQGNYALTFAKTLYFRLFALIGDLTGWILGVFSLTGLIILFLTDENRRVKLWYICGALLFLFSSMIVYDRHYSVILLLFILPLTVRPFVTGAIGRLLDKRAIMPVLVLFIVFTVVHLIISLDKNGKTVNGEPRHLIPLAEHIRSTITDKGSILSVRSLFPVRLGFSHTGYDKKIEDWQTLLDYAKEKKCKYLLADYPEYNTMPFMRFLSNDEMTAPKGAVQVVRNGLVALYKFSDTSSIDTAINAKKYEIQDILTIYGSAVRSPISPDSVRAFLMSAIKKGVPEKVAIPPFQVVTRNQGNGFERFGFVFKSSTGALVSANLTTPPSGGVQTSGKPAVLLLPGMEREGKANPLCINTAENLARAGAFVLSIDRSGTGERIGVQYSHSAILLNSAAAGHAPAEQFILEAMEASMLLPNFTGIQTDSFSVVGIGADSWSALYLSIINKKVKNIGFVGGLTSSIDMAISNERPLQAAIPSLASKCDLPTFFSALPTAKIYLVSLGGNHNMYYGSLVSNGKGTMYQFTASDSFIPLTYAPFIKGFCKGLDLQQIEPAFTYNKEEAANYTASIGSDQIASNTPLLFSYPVDDRFDTTKAPEKSASQKAVKKGDKTIIIRLYSSQTGPAVQSDAKGDKVIEVPIQLTEVYSSYRDNVNQFYDELINGTAAINLITNKINSLRDKYSGSLYIAAEDTIAAYAALKIMTSSYGFADRIFLPFLPDMRPSRLIDGILSGYDGSPYSTANMENNRNLALYRLIYHFGNFDPVEAINDAADCGTVIYTTQEKDEGFFEKVNYLKTKNEF